MVAQRYAQGHFRFFQPPVKVIPPFPTLTEICYTRVLHAPPLPGVTDKYFDRTANRLQDHLLFRVRNDEPWEQRLDYHASFFTGNMTYTNPRPWLEAELEAARRAFDQNPRNTTIAYVISASGMACKYGKPGIEEVLARAEQLCLQILYERRGAVRLSVMADHGHNLTESHNIRLEPGLRKAGLNPTEHMSDDRDVVIELCALVDYVGLHTRKPAAVADALLSMREVELATYVSGSAVVVRNASGMATIEQSADATSFRYRAITGDPLHYSNVSERLTHAGRASSDGFIADRDWFAATTDHEFPNAPRRLWDAFHGLVLNTPDVMLTLHDGYYAGLSSLERFIQMRSTHGSLNQANSATFLMTMQPGLPPVIRSEDVLPAIEVKSNVDRVTMAGHGNR
jgi:hypothetical protein